MRTPAGFAVLPDQQEYVYRATSADRVVLAVRVEKNEPRANLDFWFDVLDGNLRRSGYAPEGEIRQVRAGSGQAGRQIRYTREVAGRSNRFWLTVFVTESKVWVVEAGGDADRFKDKAQQAVQKAIESMSLGG
jgi:hypothetical protein